MRKWLRRECIGRPAFWGKREIGQREISKPESRNLKSDRHVHEACAVSTNLQKSKELQQRLISFGARTTRVAKMLPRTQEGRYISQQLLRSGLAAAPNYAEAKAAESRADFIHKLRIVLKELNETQVLARTNRRQ